MKIFWLLCLLIPIFILFVPIYVRIFFSDDLNLKIKVLGIPLYDSKKQNKRIDKNVSDAKMKDSEFQQPKEQETILVRAERILSLLKNYFALFMQALDILKEHLQKETVFRVFKFHFDFGLGDAALTGIFAGAVYTVTNGFHAYLNEHFKIREKEFQVKPDFEKTRFSTLLEIKFCVSIFWLLRLLYKERHVLLKLYILQNKKDGVSDVRASD